MSDSMWWLTKEDVLKDISVLDNFEDDYFVSGERPPPPIRSLREEEYTEIDSEVLKPLVDPDLNGIRDMLQLINENQEPENDDRSEFNEPSNKKLIISKHNPNIKEFIPRNINSLFNPLKSSETSELNKTCDITPQKLNLIKIDKEDNPTSILKSEENGTCSSSRRLKDVDSISSASENYSDNIAKNYKNKYDKISNSEHESNIVTLKIKIINASESDEPADIFERNLAIAALMKLHAIKPELEAQKSKLKLLSQEYFDVPKNDNAEINSRTDEDQPVPSKSSRTVIENQATEKELKNSVKESIKKVSDWLQSPNETVVEKKASTVVLGTVTFRKKVSNSCKSASQVPTVIKDSSPPLKIAEGNYVPSQHATDLLKKYEERKKLQENAKDDIWTKLEKDLTKRDEEIKQRAVKQIENVNYEG